MAPLVNGNVNGNVDTSSATLQHIAGYPIVNDCIKTIKNNPYGQKSIQLGDSAYQTFAKPVVPFFARPYQYVHPYVERVDHLGAGTLTKIDQRIPMLKQPTEEIFANGRQIVLRPVQKAKEASEHVLDIYNAEYSKAGRSGGAEGITTAGKALISTGLVMTSEALGWLSQILRASQSKAQEASNSAASKNSK